MANSFLICGRSVLLFALPLFLAGKGMAQRPAAGSFQAAAGSNIQDVRVLSERWIGVVLDTTSEVIAARDKRFARDMEADRKATRGTEREWYWAFSKKYHTLAICRESPILFT